MTPATPRGLNWSLPTAAFNAPSAKTAGSSSAIPQINKTQLFDLQSDPFELHDLADKPELRDKVQALLSRLEHALGEYGDKCPLSVPNPKPAAWSPPPPKRLSQ